MKTRQALNYAKALGQLIRQIQENGEAPITEAHLKLFKDLKAREDKLLTTYVALVKAGHGRRSKDIKTNYWRERNDANAADLITEIAQYLKQQKEETDARISRARDAAKAA